MRSEMHGSASRQRGSIRAIPGEFWVLIFLSLSLSEGEGPLPQKARGAAGVGRAWGAWTAWKCTNPLTNFKKFFLLYALSKTLLKIS
jgi:hypothetical protein